MQTSNKGKQEKKKSEESCIMSGIPLFIDMTAFCIN